MKLRLTIYNSQGLESKGRVLINWDNVTLVKPTSTYTDIDYTEIYLVDGRSIGVEESLEDIELILAANENSKKR